MPPPVPGAVPPPKPSGTSVGFAVGIVALVLVVFGGLAVGGWFLISGDGTDSAESDGVRPHSTGTDAVTPTGVDVVPPTGADEDGGIVVGTGPVTVDWYLDFGCPPCGDLVDSKRTVLDEAVAGGTIALHVHPLGMLDSTNNGYSSRAAAAAACAADQDAVLPYTYLLLSAVPEHGAPGPDNRALVESATMVVADIDTFTDCVDAGRYTGWVTDTTEAALTGGIGSVPRISVNGSELDDPTTLADAIAEAGA